MYNMQVTVALANLVEEYQSIVAKIVYSFSSCGVYLFLKNKNTSRHTQCIDANWITHDPRSLNKMYILDCSSSLL